MAASLSLVELYGYTAVGVVVLFSKSTTATSRPYVLASITDKIFISEHPGVLLAKEIVEFAIFVVLGVIIAVGLTSPSTTQQAIAAGLGWTGLFTKQKAVGSRRTGNAKPKS